MAEPKPSEPPHPSPVRRLFWIGLTFAALAAAMPTIAALAARFHWTFDLATHFPVYYASGFIPLVILFPLGRRWKMAAFCAFFLIWNTAIIGSVYFGHREGSRGGDLRILLANVLTVNRDYSRLLELIRQENPDVILAVETDQGWLDALAQVRRDYPHHREIPRSDNFGIAFYSKLPITSAEIVDLGNSDLPAVIAELELEVKRVTVVGLHTLPPVGARNSRTRNRQLADVAQRTGAIEGPAILLGDLNITPWSPYFGDLLANSGMKDSRRGFDIQPTWTARRPFPRIPIDHVLVSPEIEVEDRRVGPDIGSDHFPVIVDLSIP